MFSVSLSAALGGWIVPFLSYRFGRVLKLREGTEPGPDTRCLALRSHLVLRPAMVASVPQVAVQRMIDRMAEMRLRST